MRAHRQEHFTRVCMYIRGDDDDDVCMYDNIRKRWKIALVNLRVSWILKPFIMFYRKIWTKTAEDNNAKDHYTALLGVPIASRLDQGVYTCQVSFSSICRPFSHIKFHILKSLFHVYKNLSSVWLSIHNQNQIYSYYSWLNARSPINHSTQ